MKDPNPLSDQNATSEDVATLYSWANLHGAKYRDFSAARAQTREKARLRTEQAIEKALQQNQPEAVAQDAEAERATQELTPVEETRAVEPEGKGALGESGEDSRLEASEEQPRLREVIQEQTLPELTGEDQTDLGQSNREQVPQEQSHLARVEQAQIDQEQAYLAELTAELAAREAERAAQLAAAQQAAEQAAKIEAEQAARRVAQDAAELAALQAAQRARDHAAYVAEQEAAQRAVQRAGELAAQQGSGSQQRTWQQQPSAGPFLPKSGFPPSTFALPPVPSALPPVPFTLPPAPSAHDDALQGSRDRLTSRWFALRGVFEASTTVPEPLPAAAVSRPPAMAVFSLAGGVGKTSLVATLGRALSARGERVLLVDTAAFGLLPFFFGATDQRPGQLRTFVPPGGSGDAPIQMVTIDPEGLSADQTGQEGLSGEISRFSRGAGRVLIDLATASGASTRRIMRMAPVVLVPVIADMNSVVSVNSIDSFFEHNNTGGKPALPYYVLNQFDASLPLHLDVREVLREQLGERLLPFALRRAPAMSEALAEGMTVMDYAPGSTLAEDFNTLAGWVKSLSAPAATSYRGVRWSER
jgi:cellulose synthase operon protein YhjQ